MTYYRIRLNAHNPWRPEFGSIQVVVRARGYCPNDATHLIGSVGVSRDLARVLIDDDTPREALGEGAMGFPCWDIVGTVRAVDGKRPGYVVEHVPPKRKLSDGWH